MLANAIITQQDCLKYPSNDNADKLVLLDVPYIGSENTCSVAAYKYQPFYKKIADYLQNFYITVEVPHQSQTTFILEEMLNIS